MGTALSANVKNGQQLNLAAAATPISTGNLIEIGGIGNAAWPVATIDYAEIDVKAAVKASTIIDSSSIVEGRHYYPVARDRFGNIYIIGTNSGGDLVVYQFSPTGTAVTSRILDGGASGVYTPQLHQLSNGTFVCVYGRGSVFDVRFVIFDSLLGIVRGVTTVASAKNAANVFSSSCSLDGGGFAIIYQNSAGTQLMLATYTNGGALGISQNIQTFTGGTPSFSTALKQLSNGNLVAAFRSTALAAGTGGTGFVIVTTAGSAVSGPTNVDPVATNGYVSLDVLPGFFAVADANGTNLIAAVFDNAGTIQGTTYSVGNTLNTLVYRKTKIINNGVSFILVWLSSAANGIYMIMLSTAGATSNAASNLSGSALTSTVFNFDAEVINEQIAITGASATGGLEQFWMTIVLPDSNLGVSIPTVRNAPVNLTGAYVGNINTLTPRAMSGGGGIYQGSSQPPDQPSVPKINGDFVVIFAFSKTSTAETAFSIQKFESSVIVGVALNDKAQGDDTVLVNPGSGSYPLLAIAGTQGTAFDHSSSTPVGAKGVLYNKGVSLE